MNLAVGAGAGVAVFIGCAIGGAGTGCALIGGGGVLLSESNTLYDGMIDDHNG